MNNYSLLPDIFLRTPFYSFERYDAERLPEILSLPAFREAISLASKDFYVLLKSRNFDFRQLNSRERHTLAKYYNRMCFRPTPFGHFASFTLLKWEDSGKVRLALENDCRLHLLPDQPERLKALQAALRPDDLIIRNPTLYRLGKSWRYYRSHINEKGKYRFTLDEMEAGRFNNDLLRLFADGAVTVGKLQEWIKERGACEDAEAWDYLTYLLADNVLYSASQGSIISRENPLESGTGLNKSLAKNWYAAIERPLTSGGLSKDTGGELLEAVQFLTRFAVSYENSELTSFIRDFSARFEQRRVPLLEALDPDTGITFGDSHTVIPGLALLDGIYFPPGMPDTYQVSWNSLRKLIAEKWLLAAHGTGQTAITFSTTDLPKPPAGEQIILPNTLAVMFRKTAEHLVLEQVAGVSATQLIGRFSQFSPETGTICSNLAELEKTANPRVVFADIGQLSDTHTDNINRRAPIYDYEIPLNTYSELPVANQLLPQDLVLSVVNGELILESIRLGKRVIPRLATAYNYNHTELSLFRMLCALQYQGLAPLLSIDLSKLFPGMRHYPRLIFGQTILGLGKWFLGKTELSILSEGNDASTIRLRKFRDIYALPRWVAMGDSDQQLVFDLADEREGEFFLESIRGREQVILQEYLLPDRSVLSGKKAYAGQGIAFFSHTGRVYAGLERDVKVKQKIPRSFSPGSDWLYLKIYCTGNTAEKILKDVISPVIRRYARRLHSWFFIRYADPDHHLRFRMRLKGNSDSGLLLAALQVQLKKSSLGELVRDFRADTYHRELERYGPFLIGLAEEIFHTGSQIVLNQLSGENPSDEIRRFHLGFATAWSMIRSFFIEPEDQLLLAAEVANNFLREFGKGEKKFRVSLDMKYRSLKNDLTIAMATEVNGSGELCVRVRLIAEKSAQKSGNARRGLIADLVHMQLNRTFFHSQRQQEMLVWYSLQKQLESLKARKSQG